MIESAALGRKTVRGLIEIRSTYVLCRLFQICLCKKKNIKKMSLLLNDLAKMSKFFSLKSSGFLSRNATFGLSTGGKCISNSLWKVYALKRVCTAFSPMRSWCVPTEIWVHSPQCYMVPLSSDLYTVESRLQKRFQKCENSTFSNIKGQAQTVMNLHRRLQCKYCLKN